MKGPEPTTCNRAMEKKKSEGVNVVSVGCTVDIVLGRGSLIIGQVVKTIGFR